MTGCTLLIEQIDDLLPGPKVEEALEPLLTKGWSPLGRF